MIWALASSGCPRCTMLQRSWASSSRLSTGAFVTGTFLNILRIRCLAAFDGFLAVWLASTVHRSVLLRLEPRQAPCSALFTCPAS